MSEINADIPEFLKPRAKQRAEEEIQKWEKARSVLLEKRKKILEEYKIISGLDKEGVDRKGMGTEYQFETARWGKWQIFVKKKEADTPSCSLESWRSAEIARDLTINQALGQTVSEQEKPQMRAVNFLEANWSELAGIFSPAQLGGIKPVSFSNVKLGRTMVDFVGIGPDGQYIVFEISRPGKESQIEQYQRGLIDLGIPEEMIKIFRVNYSAASNQVTLLITDSR